MKQGPVACHWALVSSGADARPLCRWPVERSVIAMHREHKDARAAQPAEAGFTLLELMMVVLIIGILIAVLIPVFLGANNRAKDRAVQSNLSTAITAAKGVYTDKTDYTLATPGRLTTEAGALNFVASGTAPTSQSTVSVNAVNAA